MQLGGSVEPSHGGQEHAETQDGGREQPQHSVHSQVDVPDGRLGTGQGGQAGDVEVVLPVGIV